MSTTNSQEPLERAADGMDARRQAVLEAAIDVFADEGFRNADVQVIADRAGVGKGTVYRYFGNKEDLFWATTFSVFERLRTHLFRAMEGIEETLPKFRAACLAYAAFFEANPKALEIFVQERAMFRGVCPESHREHHERLFEHFAGLIRDGIVRGELRPIDARATVISMSGALYGAVVQSCYSPADGTIIEKTERVVDLFFEGIRARTE